MLDDWLQEEVMIVAGMQNFGESPSPSVQLPPVLDYDSQASVAARWKIP